MASKAEPEPDPFIDLTAFQTHLMVLIHTNPGASGLRIKDDLDHLYQTDINHGRLYPNLDTLVEKGLVEKGKLDDRTNTYTLTNRGERELSAHVGWLHTKAADLLD